MIDSTNPRILANNIRKLFAMVKAIVPGTVVEGNPTGSGYTNLLKKIKIGSSKYKLPDEVIANPEGETTGSLSALQIGSEKFAINGVHIISDTVVTTTASNKNESITFTNNLPDTNYAVVVDIEAGGSGWADYRWIIKDKAVGGFTLTWYNGSSHEAATLRYYVIY